MIIKLSFNLWKWETVIVIQSHVVGQYSVRPSWQIYNVRDSGGQSVIICFILHLFCLSSTRIIMHYPPACTPALVVRIPKSKKKEEHVYFHNYNLKQNKTKLIGEGKVMLWQTEKNVKQVKIFSFYFLFPSISVKKWGEKLLRWSIKCFFISGWAIFNTQKTSVHYMFLHRHIYHLNRVGKTKKVKYTNCNKKKLKKVYNILSVFQDIGVTDV